MFSDSVLESIEREIQRLPDAQPISSALGEKVAYDAGRAVGNWAAAKTAAYIKKHREDLIIEDSVEYLLDEYSSDRGYFFRPDAATNILNYINKHQSEFGFLFGDIHKKEDGHSELNVKGKAKEKDHMEYEISSFLPLSFIQSLAKGDAKEEREEKYKKRVERVVKDCKALEQMVEDLPTKEDSHGKKVPDEKVSRLATIALVDILWYLFFEMGHKQLAKIYGKRDEYAALHPNSKTGKLMDESLKTIARCKELDDNLAAEFEKAKNVGRKTKITEHRARLNKITDNHEIRMRAIFRNKFLGIYSMSPFMADKDAQAAKALMRRLWANSLDRRKLPSRGAFMPPVSSDEPILKHSYLLFFHLVTVCLERVFREWTMDVEKDSGVWKFLRFWKKPRKFGKSVEHFDIMKIKRPTVFGGSIYNPIFVVFSPKLDHAKIDKRTVAYVDQNEEKTNQIELLRLPYRGHVIKTKKSMRGVLAGTDNAN